MTQNKRMTHPYFLLLLASTAFGQDLEYTLTPFAYWSSVVCSGDGRVVAASDTTGAIYISTNSGALWMPITPLRSGTNSQSFIGLALTPDASTLVAFIAGASYSSHDLGVTWRTNSLPAGGAVLSADGTKWVCSTSGADPGGLIPGGIYVSMDAGASWQLTSAPVTNWTSIALSRDGTRLVAVFNKNQVYVSSDSGLTWTNRIATSPTNSLAFIACSSDGNKFVAIGNGIVCVSTNTGETWDNTGTTPDHLVGPMTASEDVNTLALISEDGNGEIFSSTNSGATWDQRVPKIAGEPYSSGLIPADIALSSNGSRLLAALYPGYIFSSPLPPAVLSFYQDMNHLVLSWPSNQIDFVLESAPSLSQSAVWTAVTNGIFGGDFQYFVTNAMGTASTFYRLHKP